MSVNTETSQVAPPHTSGSNSPRFTLAMGSVRSAFKKGNSKKNVSFESGDCSCSFSNSNNNFPNLANNNAGQCEELTDTAKGDAPLSSTASSEADWLEQQPWSVDGRKRNSKLCKPISRRLSTQSVSSTTFSSNSRQASASGNELASDLEDYAATDPSNEEWESRSSLSEDDIVDDAALEETANKKLRSHCRVLGSTTHRGDSPPYYNRTSDVSWSRDNYWGNRTTNEGGAEEGADDTPKKSSLSRPVLKGYECEDEEAVPLELPDMRRWGDGSNTVCRRTCGDNRRPADTIEEEVSYTNYEAVNPSDSRPARSAFNVVEVVCVKPVSVRSCDCSQVLPSSEDAAAAASARRSLVSGCSDSLADASSRGVLMRGKGCEATEETETALFRLSEGNQLLNSGSVSCSSCVLSSQGADKEGCDDTHKEGNIGTQSGSSNSGMSKLRVAFVVEEAVNIAEPYEAALDNYNDPVRKDIRHMRVMTRRKTGPRQLAADQLEEMRELLQQIDDEEDNRAVTADNNFNEVDHPTVVSFASLDLGRDGKGDDFYAPARVVERQERLRVRLPTPGPSFAMATAARRASVFMNDLQEDPQGDDGSPLDESTTNSLCDGTTTSTSEA